MKMGRKISGMARDRLVHVRVSEKEYKALKKIHNNISTALRECIRKVTRINVKENVYNPNPTKKIF
jgi:hypothetical protein